MHLSTQQHPVSTTRVTSSLNNIRSSENYFNSANSEDQDLLKNKQYQQRLINSIDLSGLTSEQTDRLKLLVRKYSDVFSTGDNDVGKVR